MKENGYINEHEKKVKNNFKTCEYNMIKVAVQIIKKTFYYSDEQSWGNQLSFGEKVMETFVLLFLEK